MTTASPLARGDDRVAAPSMGFWRTWSMTVGVMIGSGIFLLPSALAPYGALSLVGWLVTAVGAVLIALTLGHLASRTGRTGGPYAYVYDAFGSFAGFLVGWGYWMSIVIASAAIATTFAGYLSVFIPALGGHPAYEATAAFAIIWLLTAVNIAGVPGASLTQLAMTLLKLTPLLAVTGLAFVAGTPENVPEFNPGERPVLGALAATALLTMWAFAGLEAGTIPAGEVTDPKRIIPRAVVFGTVITALVYIAATAAVMALVPANELAQSKSPFADAARAFGTWGPPLIAVGALVSTAGALNGNILISGQVPMVVALDRLAPRFLARRNGLGAPQSALLLSAVLSTVFLALNYSKGLVDAFKFLITMSTLTTLAPLAVAALADLRHSWRKARAWALVALAAFLYAGFAIVGAEVSESGVIIWGLVLVAAGVPVYLWARFRREKTDAQ